MKKDFRPYLMPMMTSSTTYAVEVKMALAKRGTGPQIRGGRRGIEKWHGADRWQLDFSSSPEADRAIVSLHNIASQLLSRRYDDLGGPGRQPLHIALRRTFERILVSLPTSPAKPEHAPESSATITSSSTPATR